MRTQILVIFLYTIISCANAQTIFYNEKGVKVNKTEATNYRIYKLDKTLAKGTFKEYNMQNKLIKESGFLKFDFTDKKLEILNGKSSEYQNDTIYKINYKNNIPINQLDIYDPQNKIIAIIPIKNGKITPDSDVIKFYYYDESNSNEYYSVQGRFDGDNFFGKATFFNKLFTQTYFFNGENYYSVLKKQNIDKCVAFNYYCNTDKNKDDLLMFSDNFNCGKNNNWATFYALKETNINFDFVDIKNNRLLLEVIEEETATNFRLINPTAFRIKNNDFDVKVDILSQEGCISGITLNNINYVDNNYTDQYRIGLSKEKGVIIIEKMINQIYVNEKMIPVTDLIKDKNEIRLLKEDNTLKIILNNTLVYSDLDYTYVGESFGLYCYGNKGKYTYFDDFDLKIKVSKGNFNSVKFKKDGNLYKIPISLNDVINSDFIIDTGASNVSITPDLALLLIKSGTITSQDWLKDKYYQFADGSTARSKTFKIKKLKIGNKYLHNVECSISNNLEAPLLLGQSVLNRFGKVTMDNENQILLLE